MGQKQTFYMDTLPQPYSQTYQPTLQSYLFKHKTASKYLQVRSHQCHITGPILEYYLKRQLLSQHKDCSEHILLLHRVIVQDSLQETAQTTCAFTLPKKGPFVKSNDQYNNDKCKRFLTLLHEYYPNCLQSQIANRKNSPFSEQELWSLICSGIVGAYELVTGGFKEPLLSPKSILVSQEGYIKVAEWEFLPSISVPQRAEGELQLKISGQETSKDLLIGYYWAPEGPAIQGDTIGIGSRRKTNGQVFSLGMTVLQMCLRRSLYQQDTYTEMQIQTYFKQAIQRRLYQKIPLSQQLQLIIKSMLTWDYLLRPSYSQLYEKIKTLFQNKSNFSEINSDRKSLQETDQADLSSYLGVTMESGQNVYIEQGVGDDYHPEQENEQTPARVLERDFEEILDVYKISQSDADFQSVDKFETEQILEDGKARMSHNSSQVSFSNHNTYYPLRNFQNYAQEFDIGYKQRKLPSYPDLPQNSRMKHEKVQYCKQNYPDFCNEISELPPKNAYQNLFTDPKLLSMIRSNVYSQASFLDQTLNQNSIQVSTKSKQFITESQNDTYAFKLVTNRSQHVWPQIRIEENQEQSGQEYERDCIFKQTFTKGHYQGQKVNGMRNGFGTFYYTQGGKYVGHWLNNKMYGRGTLYYPNSSIAYEGQWRQDELHGIGKLYNERPQPILNKNNCYDYRSFNECQEYWVSYSGEFNRDDKHGKGELVLSNRERFVGSFRNDVVEGSGVFYRRDGGKVIGIWKGNLLISGDIVNGGLGFDY